MLKILRAALTLLSLTLFATGCSAWGVIPDGLAAECQKPEHTIETWRDVAELARLRGDALDECDQRMREIREITQ